MNLHACLGVGPGHQLLLGTVTPCSSYQVAMVHANAPVSVVPHAERVRRRLAPAPKRVPYGPRARRTPAQAAELRQRVLELLATNAKAGVRMDHAAVGEALQVSREYVAKIANLNGISRRHLDRDQREALVAKANRLMACHGYTLIRAARDCGISPSYLSMLKGKSA